MSSPNVLIVDDDENVTHALRVFLEPEPYFYKVLTATSMEEALKICAQEVVHVAVIDIKLKDERDDRSGLHLAKMLHPSIPKIIFTGWKYDDPVQLVLNILGREKDDINADAFAWKKKDPDELAKKIELALNRLRLNLKLKVDWERPLGWSTLVNQIKILREKIAAEKEPSQKALQDAQSQEVLQDLTRRLFDNAESVHFLRIPPGHSNCAVVMARPVVNGVSAEIWAVKFGPRDSIDREVKNYGEYVMEFCGNRSTQLREGGAVYSRELAAIAYKYIGGDVASVNDFAVHYKEASVKNICKTLDYLFKETCKWYGENARHPAADEMQPLDWWYRRQLNLFEASRLEELNARFNELLETKLPGLELKLLDNDLLEVQIEKRPTLTLPNPVSFALKHKNSLTGSDFFPPPSRMAITHGDLHANNVLVSKGLGRTWLIDFYKTGWGPALRDFAELESDIKFNLLETNSLRARFDLELALLSSPTLAPQQPLTLGSNSHPQPARALTVIEHLRRLAASLTDTEEAREYQMALLFYALKRIEGFTSASGVEDEHTLAQYHAILSAALICNKLALSSASKKGVIFLAHPYQMLWHRRFRKRFKDFLTKQDYHVLHPLDDPSAGQLWSRIAEMIQNATANFFEISSLNANVLFELGYTIGLRKPYFLLIDKAHANGFGLPSLLRGELRIDYNSEADLQREAMNVLESDLDGQGRYFFQDPDFKRRAERVRKRSKSALLISANTRHQQKIVVPVLQLALDAAGWSVETVMLDRELSISDLYLRMLRAELVVGCFATSRGAHISHANAELALALGIACGVGKEMIILQEKRGKILTDTTTLTKTFVGMADAAKVLKAELKRRFPRKYRKTARRLAR